MPPSLVDKLPLPSLRNYVLFSLVLLSSAILYAWSNAEDFTVEILNSTEVPSDAEQTELFNNMTYIEHLQCMWLATLSQPWSVWALINMCYCILTLIGKLIQISVFGDLRVSEVQQLKERFWNFAFYKFIFIFGVLNVQYMNDVMWWTAWFSFICTLQLLAQLSKYRFEYLSCSPATPKIQHVKLIFLLILILLISFCLVACSIATAFYTDWNTFGFMVAECILLIVKTVYVIMKYVIYLVDINHDGLWETRGTLAYHTDYICEMLILSIDLLQNLHMVIWSNIFLSMASIVIYMQVKYLFTELQKRYYKHKSYLQVVKSMEARFSEATEEEIEQYDDNCAICWDKMQRARKLPCGHLFHNSCLRSWLAQDVSCPTCRVSLGEQKPSETEHHEQLYELNSGDVQQAQVNPNATTVVRRGTNERVIPQHSGAVNRTNHLFHFDASRYVSWLPSFSVEVTHTQMNAPQAHTRFSSQLHSMARQVQNVFPGMSLSPIIEDLRNTHSVDITIENILEGRLILGSSNNTNTADAEDDGSDSDESYSSANSAEAIHLMRPYATGGSTTEQAGQSTDDMFLRRRSNHDVRT